MKAERSLIVVADDFGVGPATSRGILRLAAEGRVTAAVMLVNSPFAEHGVDAWRRAGELMELGWHPALTIDSPVLSPRRVPSLVDADGRFHKLGDFLKKLALAKIDPVDVRDEWAAQLGRFRDLTGAMPLVVNAHHHLHVFPMLGAVVRDLLRSIRPRPYLRRVVDPLRAIIQVPGARLKRLFLSVLGKREALRQVGGGYPGNDSLAGVTDPPFVADPSYLPRWLKTVPGRVVELTCHPGEFDETLLGRDASPIDGQQQRRVDEMEHLANPKFFDWVEAAGFRMARPSELVNRESELQAA